jgi:hypothetical protein
MGAGIFLPVARLCDCFSWSKFDDFAGDCVGRDWSGIGDVFQTSPKRITNFFFRSGSDFLAATSGSC